MTLKDLNWIEDNEKIGLTPRVYADVIKQIIADVKFLENHQIMDYSLLVAIEDIPYLFKSSHTFEPAYDRYLSRSRIWVVFSRVVFPRVLGFLK